MKIKISSSGYNVVKQKDVKAVHAALKKIEQENGIITPTIVWKTAAKERRNILHDYFPWDIKSAAVLYWEHRARMIINSVYVTVKDEGGSEVSIRAFVNVSPSEDEVDDVISGRGYMSTDRSSKSFSYKQQVCNYAMNQLLGWQARFGKYKEFYKVSQAIDALKK